MSADQNHAVLAERVTNLEKATESISHAVKSIDESLKVLTRLDVKHDDTRDGLTRAFKELEDHETRMRAIEKEAPKDNETRLSNIEKEMPTMKLVRGWIMAGVLGMLSLTGIAAWSVITGSQPMQHEVRSGK